MSLANPSDKHFKVLKWEAESSFETHDTSIR